MNRRAFVRAAVATALVASLPGTASIAGFRNALGVLTPRERQVAVLLARGLSTPEIARAFGVTRRTLQMHVCQIICKLGVDTRSEAIRIILGGPPRLRIPG